MTIRKSEIAPLVAEIRERVQKIYELAGDRNVDGVNDRNAYDFRSRLATLNGAVIELEGMCQD